MRALAFLCFISLMLPSASSQNVIFSTSNTTTFRPSENDDAVYVYEDTRNKDVGETPKLLRFYPEPLLIPERHPGSRGELVFYEDEVSRTKFNGGIGVVGTMVVTEISVKLLIQSSETNAKAAAAVKLATGFDVGVEQIAFMPLKQIEVSIPDLDNKKNTCQLKTKTIPVTGGEDYVRLQFECTDRLFGQNAIKSSVESLKQHLKSMPSTVKVTYNAKEAERASATISSTQVTSASFYSKLKGLGEVVNVSRDDMRKLNEEAKQEVKITSMGQELTPEQRAVCFSPLMTSFQNIEIDRKQVNDEVLKHTYNSADLDPTRVDKELSDTLDKGSTETHLVVNGKASGSLADVLKADTSGSVDTLNKWATEHGFKAEWNGEKWIAKSLDVLQVNTTELVSKISRACIFQTYAAGTPRAASEKSIKWEILGAKAGS